jgi:hypothetical protein
MMLVYQRLAQTREITTSVLVDQKLIWVCATLVKDGNRFASPDEFGAASSEILPPPKRQLARSSVRGAVPSFHRVDRESVPDLCAVQPQRLSERRIGSIAELSIAGNREVVFAEMTLKRINIVKAAEM